MDVDDLLMADTNTKASMQSMPGCINQPILAKQVKNELVEKKTKMRLLTGDLEIYATGYLTLRSQLPIKVHPQIVSVCTSLLAHMCKTETQNLNIQTPVRSP